MGKTGKKMLCFLLLFVHAAARGGACAFALKIVNTLIKNSSRDDRPSNLDVESTHGQPSSCRARPVKVDDGLEGIRWIRGLGGEKLPAAPYPLPLNLKNFLFFCHWREIDIFFACFLHSSAQVRLYQTPGRRPPRISGHFVNTVTRG